MHAVPTNQIADILHYNDNVYYIICLTVPLNIGLYLWIK